jgi:hypothetical protein
MLAAYLAIGAAVSTLVMLVRIRMGWATHDVMPFFLTLLIVPTWPAFAAWLAWGAWNDWRAREPAKREVPAMTVLRGGKR